MKVETLTFDEEYKVENGTGLYRLIDAYEERLTITPRPLRVNKQHSDRLQRIYPHLSTILGSTRCVICTIDWQFTSMMSR